jgi:transcription elongation factor Elf1
MDSRRISKLLRRLVRCPHCGKPVHTISIEIGGERAEVYCQKCGTFETSARKLKLFRR